MSLRRSRRKRRRVEDLIHSDLPGFQVKICPGKGRGVFASEHFDKGNLLMVYHGNLITAKEGERRELGPTDSVFRFFFSHNQKKWCVDATEEPTRGPKLGRLVNHGTVEEINAKMTVKVSNRLPVLCLQAIKNIVPGDEILYDYGLSEDEMPWLTKPVAAPYQTFIGIQDVNLAEQSNKEDKEIGDKGDHEGDRSEEQCLEADASAVRGIQDVNLAEQSTEEDKDIGDKGDHEGDRSEEQCLEADASAVRGIQDVNLAEQSTEEDKDIGDKGDHEGDRSEEQCLEADTSAVRGIQDVNLAEQSTEEDKDIGDKGDHEGDRSEEQCLEADASAVRGIQDVNLAEQSTEEDKDIGDKGDHEGDRSEEQCLEADASAVRGIQDVNLAEQSNEEDKEIGDKGDHEGDGSEEQCLEADASAVRALRDMLMPRRNSAEEIGEEEEDSEAVGSESQKRYEADGSEVGAIQDVNLEVQSIEEVGGEDGEDSDWERDEEEQEPSSSSDGGSEYLPSDDEEVVPPSDASNDSYPAYPHLRVLQSTGKQLHEVADPHQDESEEQHHEEHETDTPAANRPLQSSITVKPTSNVDGRKYDKKHVCFYCEIPQAKLARHLRSAHCEESAVVDWLEEKDVKLKDSKLTKLRNLGNHLQNCKVLEEGEGELIVRYRPPGNVDPREFVPCSSCYGYFAKKFIWKHTCPLERVSSASGKKKRGQRVRNGTMLLPNPSGLPSGVQELLGTLKSDNISRVIKSDELILQLAKKENLKLGHDAEQRNYTRTKLREIARLLIEVRILTKDPDATLTSIIDPAKYNSIVAAAKNVAGFDHSTHKYKTPSLALKVGHTLKKCATIMKGEGLISGNDFIVNQATKFLQLYEMKWTEDIAVHAHRTLTDKKRNNPKRLPLAEDIVCLTSYLKDTAEAQRQALKNGTADIVTSWKTLNEVTLTQTMLFNRRRQGEISKMTVADYNSRCFPEAEDHISDALSDFEKELCNKYKRAEIVGKKGRTVPVLLTEEMEESMTLLLNKREEAGISSKNQFMFPSTSEGHIRGSDSIRKFSVLCGAKNPNHLRSTGLRKQVATVSQVLNLKDNELDILAKFLGHDVRVHREFYRLPDSTLQVAKISKLLLSLESGATAKLAGKSLDEIEVDEDEEIPDDKLSTDSEDDQNFEAGSNQSEEEGGGKKNSFNQPMIDQTRDVKKGKPKKGRKYKRRPWSEEETEVVKNAFIRDISLNRLPGKAAIEKVLQKHDCLKERSWTNVKDFIRNRFGRASSAKL